MPRGTLKSSLLLVGTLGMVEVPEDAALQAAAVSYKSTPPTDGIAKVVQLWAAAWLDGNTEGMFACLHPGLAKHILGLEVPSSAEALQQIIGIQSLLGKAVRDHVSKADVWVLDIQGRSGSARVDLGPWTAFVHLAAHQGGWAIANVLWEWRSPGA
jgi:hypothetical protein